MAPSKRDLLTGLSLGKRVAEEEVDDLASYFVETEHWRKVLADEVDIIFGPKGAGKSAIYSTLLQRDAEMFDRGVFLISAENPRGTPAFKDLVAEPPTVELEFVTLWKLYILSLVGSVLVEWDVPGHAAKQVRTKLAAENLLASKGATLSSRVRAVRDFMRRFLKPSTVEGSVTVNPHNGAPIFAGKITLGEPDASQRADGILSIDSLLRLADEALSKTDYELWLLFDRLDVAFADSPELESNGLRALFKCYLDMLSLSKIKLKIFLRNDIWSKITSGGFREASHITRGLEILWTSSALLNLVANRLGRNSEITSYCHLKPGPLDAAEQRKFFDYIVPKQIDVGRNPATFEWIISRVQDGTRTAAPREVIHLLTEARDAQLKMLERKEAEPPGTELISRQAFRDALPSVSKVRLEQTMYAEYPELQDKIMQLDREKTEQTMATLARIWKVEAAEARDYAKRLVEAGFFEERGVKSNPSYWVPFLYRPALRMVQGLAI
ncbi:MAG: P-loop ATPase, Sll1717 family [Pseudonocardiaceae bacterium]